MWVFIDCMRSVCVLERNAIRRTVWTTTKEMQFISFDSRDSFSQTNRLDAVKCSAAFLLDQHCRPLRALWCRPLRSLTYWEALRTQLGRLTCARAQFGMELTNAVLLTESVKNYRLSMQNGSQHYILNNNNSIKIIEPFYCPIAVRSWLLFLLQPSNEFHFIYSLQPCPEQQDFRAHQCAAFDEVPYDGVLFKWTPHYDYSEPCALTCRYVSVTNLVKPSNCVQTLTY